NVLILSLTWLGVMLFVWSVYRWHNAWIGLIPGGVALFLDLALVGDNLTGAIALYFLAGFLLVMQTNLLANIRAWRREHASYPAMINLTWLNFSFWALVGLMSFAWVLPAGLNTPGPVNALGEQILNVGARFVRLAGPLQSNKVIPIHAYGGTLPFQGSVKLGDRELMSVQITDPRISGQLLLRGTTYSDYEVGGWRLADRTPVTLPAADPNEIQTLIDKETLKGTIVPMNVQMLAKTVAGTVVYSAGEPVTVNRDLRAQVPTSAILEKRGFSLPNGADMTDPQVYAATLGDDQVGIGVGRDRDGTVVGVQYIQLDQYGLLGNSEALDPGDRIKRYDSYSVVGFVPDYDPAELKDAGDHYPQWVTSQYTQLPSDMSRVRSLAVSLTTTQDNAYDKAKAIEDYLRTNYPVTLDIPQTPPDVDSVEYFLFTMRRGYFDYHASAMVVMLRTLGIPARMAVGFAVKDDDRNADGTYIVKDQNSYAWPEVYFPGQGWVPFNPTPDRDAAIAPTVGAAPDPATSGLPPGITKFLPAGAGDPIVNDVGLEDLPASDSVSTVSGSSSSQGIDWVVIGIIAFIAAMIGAIALGWQRSVSGLPYPQQVWEKTVRLASWGGAPPSPGQTPHDYAQRLGKRFRDVQRDMPTIADAYTKSRFGHKEISEDEKKALKEAWPYVRTALVGGVAGRWRRRKS
ncbi:MAG: transglutaminase domain-containing protein, partial [Chloroflexota bacterium]